jgi:hypothetical protein
MAEFIELSARERCLTVTQWKRRYVAFIFLGEWAIMPLAWSIEV